MDIGFLDYSNYPSQTLNDYIISVDNKKPRKERDRRSIQWKVVNWFPLEGVSKNTAVTFSFEQV